MRDAAGVEELLLELGGCAHYRRVAQIHGVTVHRVRRSDKVPLEYSEKQLKTNSKVLGGNNTKTWMHLDDGAAGADDGAVLIYSSHRPLHFRVRNVKSSMNQSVKFT